MCIHYTVHPHEHRKEQEVEHGMSELDKKVVYQDIQALDKSKNMFSFT
jgi:hypothetical protein